MKAVQLKSNVVKKMFKMNNSLESQMLWRWSIQNNGNNIRRSSSSNSTFSLSPKCRKCGTALSSTCSLFCSSSTCSKIQKLSNNCNIFDLFNLGQVHYDIDLNTVELNYRNLQKVVHPDKFALTGNINSSDDDSRTISRENSAFINRAHEVLKSPLERAFYIVS